MTPITLSEMDSVALMNRVDTKYVLSEATLWKLLETVANNYRVLEIEGQRESPYNTLYFDTPNDDCYIQHHNRKLNRRKFRTREYEQSHTCYLEIKFKNNKGRTDKRRTRVPAVEKQLDSKCQEFIAAQTGGPLELEPRMWTCFSRTTLVGCGRVERVTIDRSLRFQNEDAQQQIHGLVIAEVKQERDDRSSIIRQELRKLGVRPLRVSKYCLATALLRPDLKRNRFKKKLLAIRKITGAPHVLEEIAV